MDSNYMQTDIFSNSEMWRLSHIDSNDLMTFLSAPQKANISIESLLDETSCTDLPLCNIIL